MGFLGESAPHANCFGLPDGFQAELDVASTEAIDRRNDQGIMGHGNVQLSHGHGHLDGGVIRPRLPRRKVYETYPLICP